MGNNSNELKVEHMQKGSYQMGKCGEEETEKECGIGQGERETKSNKEKEESEIISLRKEIAA